jgi:hypothetical protein
MARVIVETDDGREVARFHVPAGHIGNAVWRNLVGRLEAPLGWLGRSIDDANVIQAGGDPERPSEKAIRLAAEERDAEYGRLLESGDADVRNMRWSRKADA